MQKKHKVLIAALAVLAIAGGFWTYYGVPQSLKSLLPREAWSSCQIAQSLSGEKTSADVGVEEVLAAIGETELTRAQSASNLENHPGYQINLVCQVHRMPTRIYVDHLGKVAISREFGPWKHFVGGQGLYPRYTRGNTPASGPNRP